MSGFEKAKPDDIEVPAQGSEYASYIEAELAAEQDRRSGLQSRGQTLITSSGVLLTLVIGITVFLQLSEYFLISGRLQVVLGLSVLSLLLAVGAGIWVGRSYGYDVGDKSTMLSMLNEHWEDHPVDARNLVSMLRVDTISSLRHGNNIMARWILVGQWSQLAFLTLFALGALLAVLTEDHIQGGVRIFEWLIGERLFPR